MNQFKQIICPVSPDRVDENQVRLTALGVILTMGGYFITGNWIFPAFLVVDFYIRAFTVFPYSALSWLARAGIRALGTPPVYINRAPKMFAARIGLVLTSITTLAALLAMPLLAGVTAATLVLFAFLECGINFCAGCWVYTYVVYPLVRKN